MIDQFRNLREPASVVSDCRPHDQPEQGPTVSIQLIHRTVELKLYLSCRQESTLQSWLESCCWIYNRALEHRNKAYKRRNESPTRYDQQKLLTVWRSRIESLQLLPVEFERDALRRVERGMQAFFRRVKAGQKPGVPRFRPRHRYNSVECLMPAEYLQGQFIVIPKLGRVRCRGFQQDTTGKQLLLRIIRRPSGWYAQIVFERQATVAKVKGPEIGIDVGLNSFATLSTSETINNPRFARKSEAKLCRLQRRLSRKSNGSTNRCKARSRVARHHERIGDQRKNFCHQESRKLVSRFAFIAHEKLNIRGLCRTRMAKPVHDASWGMFIRYLTYKAEDAGRTIVAVDPRGTSQECPSCGSFRKKSLSERMHCCSACGIMVDRDHASAVLILSRGRSSARVKPAERLAAGLDLSADAKSARRNRKSIIATQC